ncbi:MAG TPA: hypothetical protein VFC10_02810 [Terriglobia bacterium]|nr:hypothetical protein [Terriglobia bacterium]
MRNGLTAGLGDGGRAAHQALGGADQPPGTLLGFVALEQDGEQRAGAQAKQHPARNR